MKKFFFWGAIIALLFKAYQAHAGNFIDNPNFDIGNRKGTYTKGWCLSKCAHIGKYREKVRDMEIFDKCLALPLWYLHLNQAQGEGPGGFVERSIFSYSTDNISSDIPLYFYAEIGMEDATELDVRIEIVEYTNFGSTKLTEKKVKIRNNSYWHSIASDYPIYKTKSETPLDIKIYADSPEKKGMLQLNFIQIGSDPKALGGRGERPKGSSVFEIHPEFQKGCDEDLELYLKI